MTPADTLPPPLTLRQAVLHAEAIVAELGRDFVYERTASMYGAKGCWYVAKDKPSCLVGRILHRHGVSVETLALWEGVNARDMGPNGLCHSRRRQPTRHLLEGPAVTYLDALQSAQDNSVRYGKALDEARVWAMAEGLAS